MPESARQGLARATVTMAAVLGALTTALLLRGWFDLPGQVVVLVVVLTLTLTRQAQLGRRYDAASVLELLVIGLAAGVVGLLIVDRPWIGQPLLVVGLSIGILARRWSPTLRAAGRLVALPFIALLVTAGPGRRWPPAVAALAAGHGAGGAGLVTPRDPGR